jgi:hypothetical protein
MHTATWLIVLTMLVVGAIPVLLVWLTTMPHPKLLLATQYAHRILVTLDPQGYHTMRSSVVQG